MPLYQYKCQACNCQFEELRQIAERKWSAECPDCQAPAVRIIASCAGHVWKPGFFYHLGPKPVWIQTKEQLRTECRKRNLEAVCLM